MKRFVFLMILFVSLILTMSGCQYLPKKSVIQKEYICLNGETSSTINCNANIDAFQKMIESNGFDFVGMGHQRQRLISVSVDFEDPAEFDQVADRLANLIIYSDLSQFNLEVKGGFKIIVDNAEYLSRTKGSFSGPGQDGRVMNTYQVASSYSITKI